MNTLKNIFITIGYMVGLLLVSTLLITTLNYFDIIGSCFLSILKIVICILTLFVGGFINGGKSKQKGWLEGLKIGLIFTILIVLFSTLAFNNKIEIKNILYYLILLSSSMFGGMIGINKNIEKK